MAHSSTRRRIAAVPVAVVLSAAALVWAAAAPAAAGPVRAARATIAGTVPPWATARQAAGGAVRSGAVQARIYLAGRDLTGLTAYASAVSNPRSAMYRRYLTPDEVMARFGPTRSQIDGIESWVRSAGLSVSSVEDRVAGYVAVTGSVAAASRAFGVSFGSFRAPDGHVYRAPDQAASAPASVAGAVLTVSGLDTAPHMARVAAKLPPPPPNYWVAGPCSSYYGQLVATNEPTAYGKKQPWNNCGYTQAQVRAAYGVTASGMTGRGQTVAVVDAYASPTMPGDANQFATQTGDQPFRAGQYRQSLASRFYDLGPGTCGAAGWYGEETLDIESVHGQAPDANVLYVGAASCNDVDLAASLAWIVDNNAASIVSNSWGEPADQAAITPEYELIFEAGAAEGIGFFFASGDNGYESPAEDSFSDTRQVDFPPASPWVTGVGGTSLAVGATNNYEWETSWGTMLDPLAHGGGSWVSGPPGRYPDGYDGSSGGGVSTVFAQPSYQRGVVPTALARALPDGSTSSTPMRVVPDVAALGDPSTGMLVGETVYLPHTHSYAFEFSRIGGTSVACPTFAGIEADAQQAAGFDLGFANPAIYLRAGTGAFHDVTDHPLGSGHLAQVRNNYTDSAAPHGPLVTFLRTLGVDGEGADALRAVRGYDDATGVGSPAGYIESFVS